MRLVIKKNEAEASAWAAARIARSVKTASKEKPLKLGLPTGSSPLLIYRALAAEHKAGKLSFANVITFNMDEYAGLSREHPQSYHRFMHDNFFSHIDIPAANVHILNGTAKDALAECAAYEAAIQAAGGIDLFLGGMGEDGHIAFNEPGSSLQSRTRVVTLTEDTRQVNARFFNSIDEVPTKALTVGVGTVMDAREVLIIVTGRRKARALAACVEGPLTHIWTLSCLQTHPEAVIVCDEHAAAEIKYGTVNYFKEMDEETSAS